MEKTKKLSIAFIAIELAIYFCYLASDFRFSSADSTGLKYASIWICLAFSALFSAERGEKLITAAMVFTLAADSFLLFLNSRYALGIVLFCVVQAIYFYLLYRETKKTLWALRIVTLALALVLLWCFDMLSQLNALAAFYFTGFTCSVVQSFGLESKQGKLFGLGLVLFLCCDICVGVFNLPQLADTRIYNFAGIGMWLFYLPAQVLIVLSGRRCEA